MIEGHDAYLKKMLKLEAENENLINNNNYLDGRVHELKEKLKACETERDNNKRKFKKADSLVIEFEEKLHALEKIAREGLGYYIEESAKHPSGWVCYGGVAETILKKIDELLAPTSGKDK